MDLQLVATSAAALVVVKPAGLSTELPRDAKADSVLRRLTRAGHTGARAVHRLDRPACGLLLVATSAGAAAHYTREITARRWQKWYVARVAAPADQLARLVGPHTAYLKTVGEVATVVRSGGKPSSLDVVAVVPAPDATGDHHVLVQLHTGRFHQIRVMLAAAGAPLVGDATYGGRTGRALYLEHVVLGASVDTTLAWTVWAAPPHPDRDPWSAELTALVAATAATARTAPPPRDPAP